MSSGADSVDASGIEETVVHEVDEGRYLLRKAVGQDVDEREITLYVKEARARLEFLEYRVEREVSE